SKSGSTRASSPAVRGASLAKSRASIVRLGCIGAPRGSVDPEWLEGGALAKSERAAPAQLQAGQQRYHGMHARTPRVHQRREGDTLPAAERREHMIDLFLDPDCSARE